MNVTDLLGIVALVVKAIDTLRYATAKQVNGVITQGLAWAAGVAGTFAVAQTQWASHISVGNGGTLHTQGAFSLVAIGLALSSGGSVLKDFQGALDNTNTAVLPPLVRTALSRASSVVGNAPVPSGLVPAESWIEKLRPMIAQEVGKVSGHVADAVRSAANDVAKLADGLDLSAKADSHEAQTQAAPAVAQPPAVPSETDTPPEVHPDFEPVAGVPTVPAP